MSAQSFSPVKRYANKMVRRDDTPTLSRAFKKIGRNDICPCGNGLKYKQCCGRTA